MSQTSESAADYEELGILADTILEECDDDVALLAERIGQMPETVRDGLLCSDFLNAYQVFYFFFRVQPADIEMERLILLPASELQFGILINEIELLELIFAVVNNEPVIIVSDGDRILAHFSGNGAYEDGLRFIESTL